MEKQKHEAKGSVFREILSWILPFLFAIAATWLLKNYIIINADVPTGSMENAIMPGDRLIGNRLAYLKDDPMRGDIIIFKYPDNEEELYVKRIVGLPGETVEIRQGEIYINGSEQPLSKGEMDGSDRGLLFSDSGGFLSGFRRQSERFMGCAVLDEYLCT